MKKIIKEQVKTQVKAQVTRILPRIEEAVNAQFEAEVLTRSSHSSRTSYVVAVDLSEMELKKILIDKMEGNKSTQRSDEQRNLYKALVEAYDADKTILDTYGESTILKRRRKDDDQEGPFAGSDWGSKRQREGGEHASASTPSEPATGSAGRTTTGSQFRQLSASESAFAEEPVQPTCQMEEPSHPVFETGADDQPIIQTTQHPQWFSQPRRPQTPDRDWNKFVAAAQGKSQSWISALAKKTDARSSFNEILDTPIDFSNFIMNRLGVDTLTLELLAGPTYELMRGLCNSPTELEYHLEEVYKATTDQLDWVDLEVQQYPHNLLQPLPLIPNNQGRSVIPFEHFINNDLEYLRGGASSRKYTTSVTKTKAADYGHIKWIEDLVPRAMWIQEPMSYDKHALWGVSHWGRKRQQFYRFVVNQESTLDVYSKRRIIVVTELKIMEWHNYKHLDWILVRLDDDKIYKFKEGDLKRLRIQDIEDMLLLLVQGKLSNLTVEERFAFNFYGFAVNRESALDVYSKRRIIVVIELKIVEWHNYKYLDWISVRRDDDKIYKFKEGDLKRLRIQDIEDMLLLLVQGKLYNLTVEERFAFNVSLRMFTRSIVIQRLMEDLQLGVESYQKRLNLTKPDMYRFDLKRREAYTAYLNPRGFIYQNKDKKNRFMRIDELHKFSVRTLNDVRNALDDHLKGIRMQYLPTTFWRRGDKARAAAMI
nr:hypothetical protein [Tanacetum cinerariifolium]